MITAGGITAAVLAVTVGGMFNVQKDARVYASDNQNEIVTADGVTPDRIPAGIQGVITGVSASPSPGSRVNSLGTSADHITVGQRVRTIGSSSSDIDVSESLMTQAARMNEESVSKAASASLMSDSDYSTLLRIVEAEAGDDDVKGRVLVANVILNRVAREDFPNTVTDVVFQYVNGVPQFAPTYDGAFYTVEVTDDTREAVRQALSGTDYSEGALFFVMKDVLSEGAVSWFDTDLKHLFKYGVHDFYTYPEESDPLANANQDQEVQTLAYAADE
ncbi:MAG: cell wall hydrolase [Blautia sp.]|nr:cell wall hydrolase [Blautia sp.]